MDEARPMPDTVPRTPMYDRYKKLPTGRRERLSQAEALAADPAELARDFAETIAEFEAGYDHRDEPFHSGRADGATVADTIARTPDLALRLRDAGGLAVEDRPELSFDYVERELAVTRTTGRATFPDGTSAGKPLVADLLLANRSDRTPIIGEVKIGIDKDPYAALIQALACAAHLATAPQYQRLRNAYPEAQFPATAGPPPALDVYLIPVRFSDSGATYMPQLLEATRELSHALMQDTRVYNAVRRIACLEINLDEHGAAHAAVRFVADRS